MDASTPDVERLLHEATTKHISLRTSHPNLFRSLFTFATMQVALAINFFTSTPTFNPYGIPKDVVGLVFLALGGSQVVFLTVYRRLRLVRLLAAVSVAFMVCWGIVNTRQAIEGKASYQLPILYLSLGALQVPMLIEPRINPLTANGNGKNLNGNSK